MSMGLTLIFGVLRIVNFAHGEFLMIAMYGVWAMTAFLGVNPYVAILAIVPAMVLFGMAVHQLMIGPGVDKPHLVLVFATMGLSILMQNVALMLFYGRPLRRAAHVRRPLDRHRTILLPVELLIGFLVAVICHAGTALGDQFDLSRQGNPRDGAGP